MIDSNNYRGVKLSGNDDNPRNTKLGFLCGNESAISRVWTLETRAVIAATNSIRAKWEPMQ